MAAWHCGKGWRSHSGQQRCVATLCKRTVLLGRVLLLLLRGIPGLCGVAGATGRRVGGCCGRAIALERDIGNVSGGQR